MVSISNPGDWHSPVGRLAPAVSADFRVLVSAVTSRAIHHVGIFHFSELTTYDAIPPTTRFTFLLQTLNDKGLPGQSRHMAAILGRRLLMNEYDTSFEPLSDETKTAAKQQLLLSIIHESDQPMRRKVADFTAELVRSELAYQMYLLRSLHPPLMMYIVFVDLRFL
ncbi:unnamed protein product [Dicrocoelium dendriticum]|nr:unnamed protein product [Dicrocoelium dendriticum]